MKRKFLLLLFLFPLFSYTGVHKFYVSVTEIEYAPGQHSLQIITRVFADDFQKLLQARYDAEVVLLDGREIPKTDEYIKKYFAKKFVISMAGKNQSMNFIGKRYEKDLLILYFEVTDVSEFSAIKIKNTILTDLFEEQKNLVHVERFDETKSLMLTRDKPADVINF